MDTELLHPPRTAAAIDPSVPAPSGPVATNPVLERLHELVRRGYRAELGQGSGGDTIRLRHLGKAHDLVLYSDGRVEPASGRIPRHKRQVPVPAAFAPDDVAEQLRFVRYLDALPRPSLRDRTRPWRHKYVYLPVVLVILAGIHLAFTAMLLSG